MAAGLRLCRACRDNLAAGLSKLPRLHDECGRLLGGSGQPRDRTSGGPMPGLPFNAAAADIRAAILGVLGSWSGLVAEERRVTAPRRTAAALVTFLGRHIDWMAAHVTAGDVTDEVAELVRAAQRVAYPDTVRRVPIGACVEVGCTGELVALVRAQAPLEPTEINCDTDPSHRWPEHQWMQLSRRMDTGQPADAQPAGAQPAGAQPDSGPATRWLSAANISRLWSVPAGSVYRLASEQRWRRRNRANRTYYHEADVLDTFSRREPRTSAR